MVNPYEYQPEPKWYHTLWDLRDRSFRQWFLKDRKRKLRMYFKYESRQFFEKASAVVFLSAVLVFICNSDYVAAALRLPTDDVNELLKQDVWRRRRNEIDERKEHASKMLEESNYMRSKNSSS